MCVGSAGLFEDESSAAAAYDRALVRLRGTTASTNFALTGYRRELAEFHQAQQVRSARRAGGVRAGEFAAAVEGAPGRAGLTLPDLRRSQAVLLEDSRMQAVMQVRMRVARAPDCCSRPLADGTAFAGARSAQGGAEFEKWVKSGASAFPFLEAAINASSNAGGTSSAGAPQHSGATDGAAPAPEAGAPAVAASAPRGKRGGARAGRGASRASQAALRREASVTSLPAPLPGAEQTAPSGEPCAAFAGTSFAAVCSAGSSNTTPLSRRALCPCRRRGGAAAVVRGPTSEPAGESGISSRQVSCAGASALVTTPTCCAYCAQDGGPAAAPKPVARKLTPSTAVVALALAAAAMTAPPEAAAAPAPVPATAAPPTPAPPPAPSPAPALNAPAPQPSALATATTATAKPGAPLPTSPSSQLMAAGAALVSAAAPVAAPLAAGVPATPASQRAATPSPTRAQAAAVAGNAGADADAVDAEAAAPGVPAAGDGAGAGTRAPGRRVPRGRGRGAAAAAAQQPQEGKRKRGSGGKAA